VFIIVRCEIQVLIFGARGESLRDLKQPGVKGIKETGTGCPFDKIGAGAQERAKGKDGDEGEEGEAA
jgi:hypothetical protein